VSNLLAGKVAVVTGASSGIGRAIAGSFAAEGAIVVIADVVAEPLEGGEPTLDLIARSGGAASGAASFEKTDVSSWEDVDALIGKTVARHGRLDVMVNNAAIYSGTALLDTTAAQWERVLAVNFTRMVHTRQRSS